MRTLVNSDIKFRVGSGVIAPSNNTDAADTTKTDKLEKTHIAFGSRVTIPKHALKNTGRITSDGLERQLSSASLSSSGGLNSSSSHVDLNESAASIPQVAGQKPILQPRPPKPGSGKASRRPNPRIRSAEGAKIVKRAKLKSESHQDENVSLTSSGSKQSDNNNQVTDGKAIANVERNVSREKNVKSELEEDKNEILDQNNNRDGYTNEVSCNNGDSSQKNTDKVLGKVSQKLVGMKLGSQDDEEDYFRRRRYSENQDDVRRSKDESFSSSTDSDALFLYSSRPRSLLSTTRNRKSSESSAKNICPPEVVIDKIEDDNNNNNDDDKGHRTASFESDFHRQSSDSDNDDPLQKFHRLEGSQRNSPRASPLLFSKADESMIIRSSLLKEVRMNNVFFLLYRYVDTFLTYQM